MKNKKQHGFSLIELLIVVAIILIIAAIAIPSFISSRMRANEASAVQSVRNIQTAETAYGITYPTQGYSATLADLGDGGTNPCISAPNQACLIDSAVASGTKSGYVLTYANDGNTPVQNYTLNADPIVRNSTGQRSYFSDYPNVIHYNLTAAATAADPPI